MNYIPTNLGQSIKEQEKRKSSPKFRSYCTSEMKAKSQKIGILVGGDHMEDIDFHSSSEISVFSIVPAKSLGLCFCLTLI